MKKMMMLLLLMSSAQASDLPFHQWVVRCENGKKMISGAPYSETYRTITWDFSGKTDSDVTDTKILPPFTDPSTSWTNSKKIQDVSVTPIFATGCLNQCDAEQLNLRVDYATSGMQDGEGTSADYSEVVIPVKSFSNGALVSIKNTWVSAVNECDRGDCITDTSGSETLQCTIQSIAN
jgi:hypothetical protein